jgi:molecular chaperone HtpG
MRRMREMQALHGAMGEMPESYNVVINTNHPLVAQQLVAKEQEEERVEMAQYLYDLALLQQGMLKGAALTKFIEKTITKIG